MAQEGLHGEILLIRPLSLVVLLWLGIGLGGVLLALLFFVHVPDTVPVSGLVAAGGPNVSESGSEASFDVPSSFAPFVRTGTSLVIRCPGCIDLRQKLTANVIRVENPGYQRAAIRATIALPPEISSSLRGGSAKGIALEAEVPAGRTSLIHWLLKPNQR